MNVHDCRRKTGSEDRRRMPKKLNTAENMLLTNDNRYHTVANIDKLYTNMCNL